MAMQYTRYRSHNDRTSELEFYKDVAPKSVKEASRTTQSTAAKVLRGILYAIIGVICVLLLVVVLANYAKLTELSMEESALSRELSQLKEEQTRLTVDIDKKTTLKEIEAIATNTFGMAKVQDYQREYIDMQRKDKADVVMMSPLSEFTRKTKSAFSGIKEYMTDEE